MNPSDFFQQIPSMTTNEVRGFLNGKDVQDYNLIDVRQPGEYEQSHLPGARLIPLGELAVRVGDIDASKPTIVYCRSGNRSMAASAVLRKAGDRRRSCGDRFHCACLAAAEVDLEPFDGKH